MKNQLYEEMYRFYLKGYSLQEVAKQFGLTRQAVYTGFKRRGFKLRSKNFNKFVVYDGKKFTLRNNGYYGCTTGKRELLHRYKYEKEVRPILDGWDIHHIDHNKLNNDIDNLVALFTHGYSQKGAINMSKKLQELKKWASLNITLTNLLPINTTCNVTTRLVDILEKDVDETYYLSESGYLAKEEYGRMGKQAVETIKENMEEIRDGYTINAFNKTIDKSGLSPTLTTRPEGFKTAILLVVDQLRVRKLTPLECWRLQGFTDEQFYKAKNSGVSKSQLYKQAGNAVTVNVVDAIVGELK